MKTQMFSKIFFRTNICSVTAIIFFTTLLSSTTGQPTPGNYPNASLLLSTDTSVTPDATPANTTSINVSTSTSFKGKLEGDPTTGVVRVTDAHPAGNYTVTVTAFDNGGATASKTFTLTVTTPATCTPVSFAAAANFGTGIYPFAVAVGDFNRDGKQDLAVTNDQSANVSILLGNGAGNFSAPTNFPVGAAPRSVAVGDFNGDGKQDLAVGNFDLNNVSVLLGDGTGNFSPPANFDTGYGPFSVVVGDFNGDGKQDLVTANFDPQSLVDPDTVSILLGDGAGNFSAPTNFPAGSFLQGVAVGDFNRDGKQDLAVANSGSNSLSILLGDGAGSFSAPTNFDIGGYPDSVAVGDFNGDGKQDLAASNTSLGTVSILLGDGAGSFSAVTNFAAAASPITVAVGDFNGDGNQDIAVTDAGDQSSTSYVWILLGDGAGNFGAPTNFGVGSVPIPVGVGDFNGDGKQDLAVGNSNSNNVSILLRNCGPLYSAQVQQPINADGSSVFNAKKGVIPVKFTLTINGTPTCTLPPATIALTRTSGGTPGPVNESVYTMSADSGSNFKIEGCKYAYNLGSSGLGAGTYRIDIKINNQVVGSAVFQLK